MKYLVMIDAIEMAKLAKEGVQEAHEQLILCSQELNQPISYNESEEIIEQMMELKMHKAACENALKAINKFIKENKFILN
jgi:serine/threonine protein phosphatase PrpC